MSAAAIVRCRRRTGDLPPGCATTVSIDLAEFPFRRLAALLAREPPPAGRHARSGPGRAAPCAAGAAGRDGGGARASVEPLPAGPGHARVPQPPRRWLTRRFDLPAGRARSRPPCGAAGRHQGGAVPRCRRCVTLRPRAAPAVLMPDPVYAVYYGGAVMAGAEPVLLPATAATGFLPDLEALPPGSARAHGPVLSCSPANPQGAVADLDYLRRAVRLARRHGFVLAVDECYSELWDQAPTAGRPRGGAGRGRRLRRASWSSTR